MKRTLMLCVFVCAAAQLQAQKIEAAANAFINTLSEPLRKQALFPFDDAERLNWGFVPRERKGPTLHDFNEQQKAAALNLLKVSLSEQGFRKATGVMHLETILREVEGRSSTDTYRDPLNYHFSIFGTPSKDKPWGWRFEGHHVSLNFVSTSGLILSSTPSFFGSNPGVIPSGSERGNQLLKMETDLGFQLINSLSEKQLGVARFSEKALPEIITGNDRRARQLAPGGISYKDLDVSQQKLLMQLLEVYMNNYAFEFSLRFMEKIKDAGVENLTFAWAGGLKPGTGHYYRIQGPMLLIEYDNTQNNANHVHTSVRDLTNDFAEDVLSEHYKQAH